MQSMFLVGKNCGGKAADFGVKIVWLSYQTIKHWIGFITFKARRLGMQISSTFGWGKTDSARYKETSTASGLEVLDLLAVLCYLQVPELLKLIALGQMPGHF